MAEITKEQQEQLDNFNWTKYEQGIDQVDQNKLDEFERLVKENFVDTQADELVIGTVTHLTDREAIIDINAKSEGVNSFSLTKKHVLSKHGTESMLPLKAVKS